MRSYLDVTTSVQIIEAALDGLQGLLVEGLRIEAGYLLKGKTGREAQLRIAGETGYVFVKEGPGGVVGEQVLDGALH